MSKQLQTGVKIPAFQYDTPHQPQKSFQSLLQQADTPVMMIMLRNFGHPITRHYIDQYVKTATQLSAARLVCVVQSQPEKLQAAIPQSAMPFEIICDTDGALYDYFEVPTAGRFTGYSVAAMQIIHAAKQAGYTPQKGQQRLPLTVLIAADGTTMFAHYGKTLTDMPEDCAAMQRAAEAALLQWKALQATAAEKVLQAAAQTEAQPTPPCETETPTQPTQTLQPEEPEDFYSVFEVKKQPDEKTAQKPAQAEPNLELLGFGDAE